MKNIFVSILTWSLCIYAVDSYCDTLSVSEAMEMKLIKVSLNKSKPTVNTNSFYGSSYTGDCIIMSIENLTDKNIKVLLEAGRFMEPDDSSEQRMIVTHEQMIALYKKQKKEIPVFAMCSEMHDYAPDSTSVFEMSHKAEGDLLALAQLISKNNFQDMGAQSAIWAMTDGNDYADIYSDNESEMNALRDFVKKTKGITTPVQPQGNEVFSINTESENTYLKYNKGEISGSFDFTNKTDLSLSMILYNDKGEEFRKSFTNMTFKKGNNTLTYTYYYFNIPLGNYYVKLLDNEGKVFLEKMLTFK